MQTDFYKNFFFFFFILIIKIVNCYDCAWQYKSNVSYNLCNLKLTNDSQLSNYEVFDKRSTSNVSMYQYDFNICDDVISDPGTFSIPPNVCTNYSLRASRNLPLGYCAEVVNYTCKNDKIIPINTTTAAYQVQNAQSTFQRCFRLHNGVTPPTFSLYKEDDPSAGVVLTYTNGDWCTMNGKGRNREFRIAFICENNYYNAFDKEEIIEETELCIYETNIKSIWGCPEQCKVVNNQLCNGNGVCEYDFTNQYPRCFCYSGYYGADCTLTQDDNIITIYKDDDAKYVGLLIIIVILLVIVLTIFFYLWLRFTNTKYMAPKRKSLISSQKNDDVNVNNNNSKKRDKQQKQQSELVHEDSDEDNNVVV